MVTCTSFRIDQRQRFRSDWCQLEALVPRSLLGHSTLYGARSMVDPLSSEERMVGRGREDVYRAFFLDGGRMGRELFAKRRRSHGGSRWASRRIRMEVRVVRRRGRERA